MCLFRDFDSFFAFARISLRDWGDLNETSIGRGLAGVETESAPSKATNNTNVIFYGAGKFNFL